MFCPNCRTEFREGFYQCSDCQVPLVYELPPEAAPRPDSEFVTVLETLDPMAFAFGRSLLQSADIEYRVHGEEHRAFGEVFLEPLAIRTHRDDSADAIEILKELTENR